MIPLSTLLSRIRTRYEAEAGVTSPVRWQDSTLTTFVNEGLETLAESTGFYERYCTIPVEADRIWYDVRGFTPETVSTIRAVWSTNRNDWLWPSDSNRLPSTWQQATGDPQEFITQGIYWLGMYPHPTSSSGYLRVHFTGIPSRFTHTQAVLGDLPDQYYPALEEYALYDMAVFDGQTQRAVSHYQSYLTREKALRHYIDRRLVGSTAGQFGRLAGRL